MATETPISANGKPLAVGQHVWLLWGGTDGRSGRARSVRGTIVRIVGNKIKLRPDKGTWPRHGIAPNVYAQDGKPCVMRLSIEEAKGVKP